MVRDARAVGPPQPLLGVCALGARPERLAAPPRETARARQGARLAGSAGRQSLRTG